MTLPTFPPQQMALPLEDATTPRVLVLEIGPREAMTPEEVARWTKVFAALCPVRAVPGDARKKVAA